VPGNAAGLRTTTYYNGPRRGQNPHKHTRSPVYVNHVAMVHMYFIPEDIYLAWETEPSTL